jgi:hypothetical protein
MGTGGREIDMCIPIGDAIGGTIITCCTTDGDAK